MSLNWIALQGVSTVLATVVSAVATAVLAVLTWRYVRLTGSMVAEMRQTREPTIFVDISFHHAGADLLLILGNSGPTPAKNLRVDIQEDMPWEGPNRLADLPLIKSGLAYLAPGRILKYWLGHVDWTKVAAGQGVLSLTVTFENEAGATSKRSVRFDASGYAGVHVESFRDPLTDIADEIRDYNRRDFDDRINARPAPFSVKPCPICGETIKSAAKKCPRCHEHILEPKKTPPKRGRPPAG